MQVTFDTRFYSKMSHFLLCYNTTNTIDVVREVLSILLEVGAKIVNINYTIFILKVLVGNVI
jgi:hypothetical protein